MQSGADGDAEIAIEDGADIAAGLAGNRTGQQRQMILQVFCGEQPNPGKTPESIAELLQEGHFPEVRGLLVRFDKIEALPQADDAEEVDCAGLETAWVGQGLVGVERIDPSAAQASGGRIDFRADDQSACPRGAEEGFMAGEGYPLNVPSLHVNRNCPGALRDIENQRNFMGPTDFPYFFGWLDCAEDIGGVGEDDEAGLGSNRGGNRCRVNEALPIERDQIEGD